jgi:proteasome assembly chaperone (PAC2) family protein
MRWKQFGDCVFQLARDVGVRRILFVGSYGGSVPHTREPRMYVTCSEKRLLPEMQKYGAGRTGYEGPGSFTSYLMTQAPAADLEMVSLVAEIPSYLQGTNPLCIEAVARRLAKLLQLPLELDSLRAASTRWELEISNQIEADPGLAGEIRKLEEAYDDWLLDESAK